MISRGIWRRIALLALCCGAIPSIEAAVLVVDGASPQARDAGPATAAQPLRTLGEALRRIRPGDTLQIRPGVYRDALDLRHTALANAKSDARTVIEGTREGGVVIKGSDLVGGWQALGDGRFVRHDWQVNSQQVFVDGRALRQIGGTILNGFPGKKDHPLARIRLGGGGIWPGRTEGGADDLPYGSFYYDPVRHDLYLRVHADSLDGRNVEVSVRPFLVIGDDLRNVTVRKLGFRHANTTAVAQSGAVSMRGDGLVLEQLDIQHVDGSGTDISGNGNTIRDVTANYCGQLGIKARGERARIMDNNVSYNNTRGFNKWWEAGGAKFVGQGGLKHSVVSGNTAIGNNGDGIWFDWLNEDNQIIDNVAAYNDGFGIQYEASSGALIRANQVFGNKQRGIYLPNSRDSRVQDNVVVANGLGGIVAADARHGKFGRFDLRPRNIQIDGNIVAWNESVQIAIPEGDEQGRSNDNLFVTKPGARPSFARGFGSREHPKRIGLDAWRKASGQDRGSVATELDMPQGLRKALADKNVRLDWTVLLQEKRRLSSPRGSVADDVSRSGQTGAGS